MTWHQIETAPKDGTRVLVYQPDGQWQPRGGRVRGATIEIAYWHQPGNPEAAGFWVPAIRPSHWMQLPDPPED